MILDGGQRRAFSLIEIILAMAIIGVLLALLFPALAGARRAARRTACLANLRSIGQAVQLYRSANHDLLPWADNFVDVSLGLIAPFDSLAQYLDAPLPSQTPDGRIVSAAPYRCPADGTLARQRGTSYSYLPFALMAMETTPRAQAQRAVSDRFERSPETPVFFDWGWFHREGAPPSPLGPPDWLGRNVLLMDGSAHAAGSAIVPP